jgi:hypothetical protein
VTCLRSLAFTLAVAGITGISGARDATSNTAYTVTALGTLPGGTVSGADAINNRDEAGAHGVGGGSADTGPRLANLAGKFNHALFARSCSRRDRVKARRADTARAPNLGTCDRPGEASIRLRLGSEWPRTRWRARRSPPSGSTRG